MGREASRPVDHEMCESVRREDLIGNRSAPARVKYVVLEKEQRDARPRYRAKQVIEAGGV